MIITRLSGGMGNQMFQYAVARMLAIKNNTTVGLDIYDLLDRTHRPRSFTFRHYDLDLFTIKAEIIPQSAVPLRYRSWGSGKIGHYLNSIRRTVIGGKGKEKGFGYNPHITSFRSNSYLDGYWQSHKYFESIADIIRKDFTLKQPLPELVEVLQGQIKKQNALCIHVRRGDYVGNSFHGVVTKEYYDRAVAVIKEKTSLDHIYIFSDDIEWCRNTLSFPLPTMFVGEEYAGERASGHFSLMRACSHFIIPNSSFAWWASWLGENKEKIVIAPKQWFTDTSIDTQDLIPNEWIRI